MFYSFVGIVRKLSFRLSKKIAKSLKEGGEVENKNSCPLRVPGLARRNQNKTISFVQTRKEKCDNWIWPSTLPAGVLRPARVPSRHFFLAFCF